MDEQTNKEASVRTLERGLDILALFIESEGKGKTMTEISQLIGLHPSTTSRLLGALEKHNFVSRGSENRQYVLGSKLLQIADTAATNTSLSTASLPMMRELHSEFNESVSLYVAKGDMRVVLERIDSTQPLRLSVTPGEVFAITRGATGKVLLTWMPKEERNKILSISGDRIEIDEFERIKMRGYAVSANERVQGVYAVGAPIFNSRGEILGALGLSAPYSRYSEEVCEKQAQSMKYYAQRISLSLGWKAE